MFSVAQEVDDTRRAIDQWYKDSSSALEVSHAALISKLRHVEAQLLEGGAADSSATPQRHGADHVVAGTPQRPFPAHTPASPPFRHSMATPASVNYDTLLDEVMGSGLPNTARQAADRGEGVWARAAERCAKTTSERSPHSDGTAQFRVIVEFKRQRRLQYESQWYVAPRGYVVVGGDRGEDIGRVVHAWRATEPGPSTGEPCAMGAGKVLRVATDLEASQLEGVQSELEMRAVHVAQEKVVEHALPMIIVDAEYQFDRRKLTFYYHSQQRLDFRNLVRDLYKTFRARIWMEPDNAAE